MTRYVALVVGSTAAVGATLILSNSTSHFVAPTRGQDDLAVEASVQAPREAPPGPRPLVLPDGSRARPLTPSTVVVAEQVTAGRVILELKEGKARFDVVPSDGRVFRVRAGHVAVEVIGTEFVVGIESRRVTVEVVRGLVQVDDGAAIHELHEGERIEVSRAALGSRAAKSDGRSNPPNRAATRLADKRKPSRPEARSVVEAWLREADAARREGAWHRAARLLDQAIAELGSKDRRTAVVLFQRGRVLMELGRFAPAARSFAESRALAPQGPLAEDALAREVESLARAGQPARARELAIEYREQYRDGRRQEHVERWGDL